MNKITSILLLSVLSSGCQLSDKDDETIDQTTKIIGKWESSCFASGNDSQPEYNVISLEFGDSSYYRNTNIYSDDLCNNFIRADEIAGTYTYEPNREIEVSRSHIVQLEELEVTVIDPITSILTPSIYHIRVVPQGYANPGLYFSELQIDPYNLIDLETYKLIQ
ncbi:MAG: hypothetical protein JXR16_02945 [Bermanella sp.]